MFKLCIINRNGVKLASNAKFLISIQQKIKKNSTAVKIYFEFCTKNELFYYLVWDGMCKWPISHNYSVQRWCRLFFWTKQ